MSTANTSAAPKFLRQLKGRNTQTTDPENRDRFATTQAGLVEGMERRGR